MEGMQRLNTASSFVEGTGDPAPIKVSYKTGAQFEGKVQGHKRTGHGTFIWPNGCKYEGEFSDNLRHGKGSQVWSDSSSYVGDFVNDLRHGEGSISWSNGESYEGTFFKDRRHGTGVYKWPDNSSYTGTFYMDKKEGYGTFKFTNGDMFQGLYKEDEREGPGVVTYKDGRQDVGLWHGEKLIKLCSATDNAFTITSHPEFDIKHHVTWISVSEDSQSLAPLDAVLNPPSILDYPPKSDLTQKVNELYSEALDPRSLAVDRETFDNAFFKNCGKSKNNLEKVVAWNATPIIVSLQKHTLKHTAAKGDVAFNVEAVIKLDRSKFKEKGPLELQSEELIVAAQHGDSAKVETLLNSGKVHPDVSDRNGHTALIGATVNWHIDVINVLLNQGADVNKLSDEGCSALSAGTIFYYPVEGFLYNIAEGYMAPPQDVKTSEGKIDAQLKGILLSNNKERRASRLNQINKIKSELSGVKIVTTRPSGEFPKPDLTEKDNEDNDSAYGGELGLGGEEEEEGPEEFESNQSMRNYHIEVTDQLVERCATQLSHNEHVISREGSEVDVKGKARRLAVQMSHHERMKDTLNLLLRRGADPNASSVPMPVLFFAIKSADVEMVTQLLMKGANTNTRLSAEKGGLYPIHIACAIPGEEGVQITELLLDALANPDSRAEPDDAFLNHTLEEEWSKDPISEESQKLLGGRTALQIACARDDNYKHACKVVRLLLEHKADTNLMCNGFSPLALAITSGNDMAIDELLLFGADPSLALTHGVGSALCVATSTQYEHRRTIQGRTQLVDKLIRAGADVLSPIYIGPKRVQGTAVDYAYYMFNQDRRIAHMPYHALTHAERDTYNARRKLLGHIGDIMRNKAVEREKRRNFDDEKVGVRSQSPSANFVYIGAGAKLPPGVKPKSAQKAGQVKFENTKEEEEEKRKLELNRGRASSPVRKPLFKYCYECGRSVGVRLAACTRCKEVYYCSKACKLKAWNARHREECIRIGGRSRSPSPKNRAPSPTAATHADRSKHPTVKINGEELTSTLSQSLLGGRSMQSLSSAKSGTGLRAQGSFGTREVLRRGEGSGRRGPLSGQRSSTAHQTGKDRSGQRLSQSANQTRFKGMQKLSQDLRSNQKVASTLPSLGQNKQWLVNAIPARGSKKSAELPHGKHKFRTGSPPNYQYVYVDNYSHN